MVGVRGIGPKKAKNLISKHLTIENVYMAIPGMVRFLASNCQHMMCPLGYFW